MSLSSMASMTAPTVHSVVPAGLPLVSSARSGRRAPTALNASGAPRERETAGVPGSDELRQTLAVVLQPEFCAAKGAADSDWFNAARRVANTGLLTWPAVACLFDEGLLADFGHSLTDRWFAWAWMRLTTARDGVGNCGAPPPEAAAGMTPQRVLADERPARTEDAAPPGCELETLAASRDAEETEPTETERVLRLLPEVTQSVTAEATSVEALAAAYLTQLTGRAA